MGWSKVALGHFLEILIFLLFVFDFGMEVFLFFFFLKVSPWYAKFFYMGVWVDDFSFFNFSEVNA